MKYDEKGASAVAEHPRSDKSSPRSENTSFTRRSEAINKRADAPLPDKEEMQRRVDEAGKPGEGHRALDAFVGEWDASVKCWMDPAGPPTESKGRSRLAWILNGHFLREEFEGEMMGKPFKGLCIFGYDNTRQLFNCVWIDDTNTSMFTSQGKGESTYKVLTLEGSASCPVTGRKDIPMRLVLTNIDRDKHLFEMFDITDGKEVKGMEIT